MNYKIQTGTTLVQMMKTTINVTTYRIIPFLRYPSSTLRHTLRQLTQHIRRLVYNIAQMILKRTVRIVRKFAGITATGRAVHDVARVREVIAPFVPESGANVTRVADSGLGSC